MLKNKITILNVFIGGDDFVVGQLEISFTSGTMFNLTGCTIIQTNDDSALEGDHEFVVGVDEVALANAADGRVTAQVGEFTVTITDSADGE